MATPKLAGDYSGPKTQLLEWEKQFFQSSTVYWDRAEPAAERRMQVIAVYPSIADRNLIDPCQDIVDDALASGNDTKLEAALNWVRMRQSFYAYLWDNKMGLRPAIEYELTANYVAQCKLVDKLDGTKSRWLN